MSYQTFWTWFAGEAEAIRTAFAAAAGVKDYPALDRLVQRIGDRVHAIDPRVAVRLNGGASGDLALVITTPDPAAAPIARELLASAPAIAGWKLTDTIESPAKNIIVRGSDGDEIVIAHADIRFRLLPPKPDGSVSVIFAVPAEFDPKSERGRLYQAAANEILKHTFGGPPPGMGSYAMVPASWLDQATRPIDELAAAWAERTTAR